MNRYSQTAGDAALKGKIANTVHAELNWDDPIGKMVVLPMDSNIVATVVGLIADYTAFYKSKFNGFVV